MSRIEICGKSYPYRCDMVILERIQSEFGDVVDFENAIRGIVPYYDEETGHVVYIKDQVGRLLDESVDVGEPLPEEYLNEITTIYREDNIGLRSDKELIEVVENIHTSRTEGGFGLNVFKEDLKKRLGDD